MEIAGLGGGQPVSAGVAKRDAAEPRAQAEPATPELKYLSPTLKYDPQSRLVLFQVLNPDTGAVVRQYPSEKVVKLYRDGSDLASGAASSLAAAIPGIDPQAGKAASTPAGAQAAAAGKPAAPATSAASNAAATTSETEAPTGSSAAAGTSQAASSPVRVVA